MPPRTSLLMAMLLASTACGGAGERQPDAASEGEEAGASTAGDYRPPRDLAQLDACALLPPTEIPARFGKVTEGPTLARNPEGWPTCSYVLEPNTGLIVELIESQWYDLNRNLWDKDKVQDISGIGEKAYLISLKPPSDPYLVAAKGDIAVKVTTRNLEPAREAARLMLAKL